MENPKNFIIDAEDLDSACEASVATARARTGGKQKALYETCFVSGPDWAVRRVTPKTSTVLACVASKGQLYLKNEKTDELKKVGAEDFRKFFVDAPAEGYRLEAEDGTPSWWGDVIFRGADYASFFVEAFWNEAVRSLVTSGLFRFSSDFFHGSNAMFVYRLISEAADKADMSQVRKLRKFESVAAETVGRDVAVAIASAALLHADAPTAMDRVGKDPDARRVAKRLETVAREMRFSCFSGTALTLYFVPKEGAKRGPDGWRFEDMESWKIGDVFEIVEQEWGEHGVERFVRAFFDSDSDDLPSPNSFLEAFISRFVSSWHAPARSEEISADAADKICELAGFRFEDDRVDTIRYGYVMRTRIRYELDRFLEYVFREAYAQGYHLGEFFSEWNDTTRMQMDVYGKIVDKYPSALASFHRKVSYKHQILQEETDERRFAEAAERMKGFRWKKGEWIVTSPETRADMLDEAQAQSNCLSSYVELVANESCMIFFLRRAEAPDKSYVTIEVREDGSLGQVKARFNAMPSRQALAVVGEWHDKFFSAARREIA